VKIVTIRPTWLVCHKMMEMSCPFRASHFLQYVITSYYSI
jgi:hypothetical protein